VVARLSREVARTAQLPEVRSRIESTGNEAVGSTPEEFDAKFRADVERFKKIVQDARLPYQD
jgi:tripartite-type tricarboxylate transporter receptor subunit TctC